MDEAFEAFLALHNPKYIWADAYGLFERIMNLGVKELYYKEIKTVPQEEQKAVESNSMKNLTQVVTSGSQSAHDISMEKDKQSRIRKQKLLELNQEDA